MPNSAAWQNNQGLQALKGSSAAQDDSVQYVLIDPIHGAVLIDQVAGNLVKPQNAVAVATEVAVWTPAAGKKFRLRYLVVASSVAGNLVFRDATAGTIILIVPCTAGAPVTINLGRGILSAAANNALTCTGPATATLSGTLLGNEE